MHIPPSGHVKKIRQKLIEYIVEIRYSLNFLLTKRTHGQCIEQLNKLCVQMEITFRLIEKLNRFQYSQ